MGRRAKSKRAEANLLRSISAQLEDVLREVKVLERTTAGTASAIRAIRASVIRAEGHIETLGVKLIDRYWRDGGDDEVEEIPARVCTCQGPPIQRPDLFEGLNEPCPVTDLRPSDIKTVEDAERFHGLLHLHRTIGGRRSPGFLTLAKVGRVIAEEAHRQARWSAGVPWMM